VCSETVFDFIVRRVSVRLSCTVQRFLIFRRLHLDRNQGLRYAGVQKSLDSYSCARGHDTMRIGMHLTSSPKHPLWSSTIRRLCTSHVYPIEVRCALCCLQVLDCVHWRENKSPLLFTDQTHLVEEIRWLLCWEWPKSTGLPSCSEINLRIYTTDYFWFIRLLLLCY
jgi:hypothetical protein